MRVFLPDDEYGYEFVPKQQAVEESKTLKYQTKLKVSQSKVCDEK